MAGTTGPFDLGKMAFGGLGQMFDGIDSVKRAWSMFNAPSALVPTLDVDELDKRIADLKAVEQWLNLNVSMLRGTIQGLEIQRGTLAAVKAFGASFNSAMPGGAGQSAAAAPAAAAPSGWPHPAPAASASAHASAGAAKTERPRARSVRQAPFPLLELALAPIAPRASGPMQATRRATATPTLSSRSSPTGLSARCAVSIWARAR